MKNSAPLSVFLVDDDRMFLSSLKYDLNDKFKSDIHISTFTSGEDCLKKFQSGNADIVILDYYLNDDTHPDAMDGLELLKKIKSKSGDTTVIMLSAQDKLQIAIDSIKNGAYEYVAKSESTYVRMHNMIKNVVGNIRSERETRMHEKWNIVMGIFILLLILFDIIYYSTR